MQVFNEQVELIEHINECQQQPVKSEEEAAPSSPQKVIKVQGDSSLVTVKMVGENQEEKTMVLDLNKLRSLMNTDDSTNVLTVPLGLLQQAAIPIEEHQQMQAALAQQQQDEMVEEEIGMQEMAVEVKQDPGQETIMMETSEVVEQQLQPHEVIEQQLVEQGEAVHEVIEQQIPMEENTDDLPAMQHLGVKEGMVVQTENGQILQPVGNDQLQCTRCGQLLSTMKEVASHVCLITTTTN
jgi:hypothetical protein